MWINQSIEFIEKEKPSWRKPHRIPKAKAKVTSQSKAVNPDPFHKWTLPGYIHLKGLRSVP